LLALTLGCFWLIRRYGLLRSFPGSTRRHEALESVASPTQPGAAPMNIGLILILSAIGVWAVSAMLGSIPYTLAASDGAPPPQTLSLNAKVFGTMSGGAIVIVAIGCVLWAPLRRMLGLPNGVRELAQDLKLGAVALGLALPPVLLAATAVGITVTMLANAGLIDAPDPLAHETLRELAASGRDASWWAVIAMVVIAVPIAEELIYRGLLQTGLRANLGVSPSRPGPRLDWVAVIMASGLFTIVHLGAAAPHALIVLLVLSLAMGIAYERTGRILVPILMHVGFNGFNILVSQG
jgi:membrane protease YdiL (CAAX protease family)